MVFYIFLCYIQKTEATLAVDVVVLAHRPTSLPDHLCRLGDIGAIRSHDRIHHVSFPAKAPSYRTDK